LKKHEANMEIGKWIRVDRPVNISPDLDEENWYPARVLEVGKTSFWISMPARRSIVLRLQKGQKIRVSIASDQGVFLSTCGVLDLGPEGLAGVEVEIPQELVHMERRRFARCPTRMEVYYAEIRPGGGGTVFTKSYSADISGGGMRLELHRSCREETLLRLKFTLPVGKKHEEFLLTGRIVRAIATKPVGAQQAGIEFVDISSGEQEAISQFVTSKLKLPRAKPNAA
jgi:c-di-GMP-binding flagellar brake protein YcgR